ncbi:MAG: hypothetical protein KAH54_08960 [Candidatus Sabulitectum sp.]|nr:hypothetical protein [Candidatus Sabulitectum sp.]
MVFRKIIPLLIALLIGTAGCSLLGGGGLGTGDTADGDLDNGVELGELIPDAEETLLAAGFAVEDDWPAIEFSLAAEDGLSLFVEADDIDPVIVVVDAEGEVLVAGDDWDEELDAFVSLDEVPAGARAIVFDITGDDGTFLLEVDESDDYDWTLQTDEEYEAFILEDKGNEQLDDLLQGFNELYHDNWEACRVFPLEVRGEKWLRIAVDSDIDCVMTVLLVDGDDLEFVDYDDDTDNMNPVFSGMVESGSYLVVVDTYSGSEDAEFDIEVTELDPDDMSVEVVDAYEMDTWFGGEFREGALVMNYWPDAGDDDGIYPEELALVFEFEIEEEGEYIFDASCYDDTKMVIINDQSVMVDYNDDGPEGLDPQLTIQLSPGFYSAIVVPYSEGPLEYVDFRYFLNAPMVRETGSVPLDDTFQMQSNVYLSMMFESGNTYELFAESDVDLTLTVVDRAGEEYFSDDDGGNFNPYLLIECTRANSGEWLIDLESYSGDSVNEEVFFVVRVTPEIQESVSSESSAPTGLEL